MQIICTGASGLVGYNFINAALERGHKVLALHNSNDLPDLKNLEKLRCDLSNIGQIQRLILDRFPDAIVNCAAISSPAVVDVNPQYAQNINVILPEKLAELAYHVGSRFLHLSSDLVFDGTVAPYKNTDIPMPLNLYGQMKLLAEKNILKAAAPVSVVLRITHVCGNGLMQNRSLNEKLFLDWASGKKVQCPTNDIRQYSSAKNIADLLVELCERQSITGLHHFCGKDAFSKFDMAKLIAQHFELNSEELIEPITIKEDLDFRLDCSDLEGKVKTRRFEIDEILSEMRIPDACVSWYEGKGKKMPIKRFKLD